MGASEWLTEEELLSEVGKLVADPKLRWGTKYPRMAWQLLYTATGVIRQRDEQIATLLQALMEMVHMAEHCVPQLERTITPNEIVKRAITVILQAKPEGVDPEFLPVPYSHDERSTEHSLFNPSRADEELLKELRR